jgi:hypothetical protein
MRRVRPDFRHRLDAATRRALLIGSLVLVLSLITEAVRSS